MRFAYADPPYLGCCSYYKHNHGTGNRPFDGKCWNDIETHKALIEWADANYDGFALCMGSNNISALAPLPLNTRILRSVHWGAWVKPFASFKPGVNPGYCWEPVAFVGGRPLGRSIDTVRDFLSEPITLKKGWSAQSRSSSVCGFSTCSDSNLGSTSSTTFFRARESWVRQSPIDAGCPQSN